MRQSIEKVREDGRYRLKEFNRKLRELERRFGMVETIRDQLKGGRSVKLVYPAHRQECHRLGFLVMELMKFDLHDRIRYTDTGIRFHFLY